MSNLKILIAETRDFSPEAVTRLRSLGEVHLQDIEKEDVTASLQAYDVFWFRLKFKITAADLPENPRCRLLICPVTGLDHIDLEACKTRGIEVLSLRGETDFLRTVRATAELTLGLALALLRKIPAAAASVQHSEWERDRFKGHEIYGKKVGILGVGRLGSITATYFQALGAEVSGFDIKPFDPVFCRVADSLEVLFAESDLVSIHVAYTSQTHHLVGRDLLRRMKPTAILLNTARGGVVDSAALLEALQQGWIAGAALDVLEHEPDLAGNPLVAYAQQHDNLLITPHIGGNTEESFSKTELFMAEELKKIICMHKRKTNATENE